MTRRFGIANPCGFGLPIVKAGVRWLEGFDDFDFASFAEEVDVDAAGVAMDQDVAGVCAHA